MKVRVLEYDDELNWYASKLDEIVEVEDGIYVTGIDDFGEFAEYYYISKHNKEYVIPVENCEVIEETKRIYVAVATDTCDEHILYVGTNKIEAIAKRHDELAMKAEFGLQIEVWENGQYIGWIICNDKCYEEISESNGIIL